MSAKHHKSNALEHDTRPELAGIPNTPFPLKRVIGALLGVALAFAAAAVLLPKSANAMDTVGLNAAQTKTVKGMESYLNAIKTLRARFMQATSQGQYAQGMFWMRRPGEMRIDYDPPTPVLIVSDGLVVMYKDEELDQLSHVLLNSVPASMFIGEKVDFFGEDLLITGYQEQAQVVRLTLQRSADPMEGSLTLVFEQNPMALRKWTVVDAQGVVTTVSLVAPKFGETFDDELFKVENQAPNRRDD